MKERLKEGLCALGTVGLLVWVIVGSSEGYAPPLTDPSLVSQRVSLSPRSEADCFVWDTASNKNKVVDVDAGCLEQLAAWRLQEAKNEEAAERAEEERWQRLMDERAEQEAERQAEDLRREHLAEQEAKRVADEMYYQYLEHLAKQEAERMVDAENRRRLDEQIERDFGGAGCAPGKPVKGNLTTSSGERIYHVPGGAFYDRTIPEECFATEADARAAGYRRSQR